MFGSLLERPLVATYALTQYPHLVAMFEKELDCCGLIYNRHLQTSQKLGESPNLLYFLFIRNGCNDNYYNYSNNSLLRVIYTLIIDLSGKIVFLCLEKVVNKVVW